jgi:hypothetical protein
MTDLQAIEINKDVRLCSFDIENMYTNIPKAEVINIINNIIQNSQGTETNVHKEIIMKQNYFQFNQEYYKQVDG